MTQAHHSGLQRPPIIRLLLAQLLLAILISTGFLLNGLVAGYSALLGGLIFVLPNYYFAHKAFSHSGARAAQQIMKAFYQGEAAKITLTALFFTLVYVCVKPIDTTALMCTFAAMLVSNWLTPVLLSGSLQRPKQL